MLVPYNESDSARFYEDFYRSQVGHGLAVYRGRKSMSGRGIGSFLSSALKTVAPVLRTAAKSAGKKLLKTGVRVATDVAKGENVGASLKRRFKDTGMELLDDTLGLVSPTPKKKKATKRDLFADEKPLTKKPTGKRKKAKKTKKQLF